MRAPTVTTDEFLTDKQSVHSLHSIGRLELELEKELVLSSMTKREKDNVTLFQEMDQSKNIENER